MTYFTTFIITVLYFVSFNVYVCVKEQTKVLKKKRLLQIKSQEKVWKHTWSSRVMIIKPPEDSADHEGSGSGGAVLSRNVSLLCQPCGHVIHDGHYDADGFLRNLHSLGQLELRTKNSRLFRR